MLVTDSRKVKKGDTFIALRGVDTDGHDYIESAINNGASTIICETGDYSVPTVKVDNTNQYYLDYIYNNNYEKIEGLKLIGVTGTSGKTTTCFLVYNMLKKLGCKVAYIGTIGFYMNSFVRELNNTTPLIDELYGILSECKDNGMEYVVMEVSSHALDLDRVYGLKFDACGFTNISQDHLDYHKTIEAYATCKVKLFTMLRGNRNCVINIDDSYSSMFLLDCNNNVTISEKSGDVSIYDIKLTNLGIDFKFDYLGKTYSKTIDMVGKYNIYNYMMAVMLINSFGFSIDSILSLDVRAPRGRMEMVKFGTNSIFVDYAHKPDAVKKVLENAHEFCKGKIITIIGCGGNRDRLKRPIMGGIASDNSDYVIFTNDNPRNEDPKEIMNDIIEGVKNKNYEIIFDRKSAINKGVSMLNDNDILLILGKGHEDYQIIKGVKYHLDDMECVNEAIKNIG
jgi:UDP-N-acetylmuramoyl-L-alanyl-D-glutamate--2,6-diaminopimelate ligase